VQELPQHRLACSVRIEDGSVEMQWWRGAAASGDAMTMGRRVRWSGVRMPHSGWVGDGIWLEYMVGW
jgi:hypothetical protein